MKGLYPGTIIDHYRYGEGIVSKIQLSSIDVFFEKAGKVSIPKESDDYSIVKQVEQNTEAVQVDLDLQEFRKIIDESLEKHGLTNENIPLGDKWIGGKIILEPANTEMQSKEIPIETFFHKIVMLRDRLRVLEQNINSHKVLNDEDKVHLQQYITRSYGSLTTFNVLFKDKNDQFSGSSKSE
jgi:hypothetical protein